jgi:hypothetical protein
MADKTLHAVPTDTNRKLSSAFFEGALAFEDLALDIERARDSAHSLASSATFDDRAQNVFYALGDLCDRIHAKTRLLEDKFTSLAEKHREPTQ